MRLFLLVLLFVTMTKSEILQVVKKSERIMKPMGFESLVSTFNSTREARRSVVSGGLFSIVSFDNVPCMAMSGDIGTCYSQRECTNLMGTASGVCAGNFGVCCVVTPSCGGTVTTNNTYFINTGFPATVSGPLMCSVTVNKLAGASELYLEFTNFQIAGPTLGDCTNDTFTVTITGSTSSMTVPILCGNLGNQMYYIDISKATGPFTLKFNLGSTTFARSWKIRIVQFKTGDACAAPSGCSLYFRDPSGTVETFNYNMGQGELINNICINVCFQLQPGFCSIMLTENEFMLSGIAPNDCTEGDYLLANGQRFCGDTLGNGMLVVNQTMSSGFLQIQVCSGNTNPDMDLGFKLNYTQLPCPSSVG
ncbi:CUB and sushi domain-containing protein 2 [Folsomia candida]|uniref:CUB and sushi domain-containing protein 2 n=2 Tax=Folsomia candida TaxID=158441 RepID=A0A226E7C9_FOLCA|nr:CUB and sushi domain-containing protein 2 [Folsomia candida]